jgi:hypothetical protein
LGLQSHRFDTLDFLHATKDHSVIMNFSTHPAWMFAQEKTFAVATDPDAVQWNYAQGKEVLDPAGKEMASYYERLFRWYAQGGFTDELVARARCPPALTRLPHLALERSCAPIGSGFASLCCLFTG